MSLRRVFAILIALAMTGPTTVLAQSWPSAPWPISEDDVEKFAIILALEPDQVTAIQALRDDHEAAYYGDEPELLKEHRARAHRAVEVYGDADEPIAYETFTEALKYAERFRSHVEMLDVQFMTGVEALLVGDEQHANLDIVRQWRERQTLYESIGGHPKEGVFDLLSQLELEPDEDAPPHPDSRMFRVTHDEFRTFIPHFRTIHARILPQLRVQQQLDEELAPERYISIDLSILLQDPDLDPEGQEAFMEELDRITAEMRQRRRPVVQTLYRENWNALQILMEALEEPYRKRSLWEFYLAGSHGHEVWPDYRNAYSMYARALAIYDLNGDELDAISAHSMAYRQRHDALTMEIVEVSRKREVEALIGRAPQWRDEVELLQARKLALLADRDALNVDQWRLVKQILVTPDRIAELPPIPAESRSRRHRRRP